MTAQEAPKTAPRGPQDCPGWRCEGGLALGRGTIAITIIRSRFGTPASADAGAGRRAPRAGAMCAGPPPQGDGGGEGGRGGGREDRPSTTQS